MPIGTRAAPHSTWHPRRTTVATFLVARRTFPMGTSALRRSHARRFSTPRTVHLRMTRLANWHTCINPDRSRPAALASQAASQLANWCRTSSPRVRMSARHRWGAQGGALASTLACTPSAARTAPVTPHRPEQLTGSLEHYEAAKQPIGKAAHLPMQARRLASTRSRSVNLARRAHASRLVANWQN